MRARRHRRRVHRGAQAAIVHGTRQHTCMDHPRACVAGDSYRRLWSARVARRGNGYGCTTGARWWPGPRLGTLCFVVLNNTSVFLFSDFVAAREVKAGVYLSGICEAGRGSAEVNGRRMHPGSALAIPHLVALADEALVDVRLEGRG